MFSVIELLNNMQVLKTTCIFFFKYGSKYFLFPLGHWSKINDTSSSLTRAGNF